MVDSRGSQESGNAAGAYGDAASGGMPNVGSNATPQKPAAYPSQSTPEYSGHEIPSININDDEIPF